MTRLFLSTCLSFVSLGAAYAVPPATCVGAQSKFDSVQVTGTYNPTSWSSMQELFGPPLSVREGKPFPGWIQLIYAYPGCELNFDVDPNGKVSQKGIRLTASALLSPGSVT